ncbi:MAG: IPT/TIG domain-containing protein, partial [Cyclobacteriaceae bacterium]|nr:IPT/TIG domain-containing protein [Cyclobacteriaceae bacterium]
MVITKRHSILLLFIMFVLITCSEQEIKTRDYPVINTLPITNIDENGSNFNAEILNLGFLGIKDHGFVYSLTPDPLLENADFISLGSTSTTGEITAFANRNLIKNRRYYVRAYAIANESKTVVYGQQKEFFSLGNSTPTLINIFPTEGIIGDTVLVTGTGFSNVLENNNLFFFTNKLKVFKNTIDSLWAIVPEGAYAGLNDVSLYLGQHIANCPTKFYIKPLEVTSLSPYTCTFSDTITIKGNNFPLEKSFVQLLTGFSSCTIIKSTRNEIQAIVPPNITYKENTLLLKVGTQKVSFIDKLILKAPIIYDFFPKKGTVDSLITIIGKNFSPSREYNRVKIGIKELKIFKGLNDTLYAQVLSGIVPG